MNVKTVDTYNFVNNIVQSLIQQSIYNSLNSQKEFCGVINAWTEAGLSDNEDYSVLNVTTVFDSNGKDLKNLLNIGVGKEILVQLNIQIDSANPISFFEKKPQIENERPVSKITTSWTSNKGPLLRLYRQDVAAKIAKVFEGVVLFINLDLTNAYNQLTLNNATSHRKK